MTITCECCEHQLTKKEIVEEIAQKQDWEKGMEYGINEGEYDHKPDTATIYKEGLENLLQKLREVSSE